MNNWHRCTRCDTTTWSSGPKPCQLCQYIMDKDHAALDQIADLMTKVNCEPHVSAVVVAQQRERQEHPR